VAHDKAVPSETTLHQDERALRTEIVRVCRLMHERGLIAATDGNVSTRLGEEHLLTTPTGVPKGLLREEDLVITDLQGQVVPGGAHDGARPSAELRLHLEAYRLRPDVVAVVHAHPPMTTALTVAGVSLAPCVIPETLVNLGTIATTAYATPTSEQGPQVIRALIGTHDALALDRHGAVTEGQSPMDAYGKMEKVENTAVVLAAARALGQVKILPLDEIRRLVAMRREHLGLSAEAAAPDCARCGACPGFRWND